VFRNPSPDELRLLDFLILGAKGFVAPQEWRARMRVADINDSGMGSLRLFPEGSDAEDSHFGKRASACQFTDEDGVEVIVSLNLDQRGSLYELDIWKTDFGKLIRIPKNLNEVRREQE
jgi:hypothetical protein